MATNSFIRVPPDSTGKRLYTLEHTVDATAVQGQAVHNADPHNPEQMQHVDVRGAASVRFTEGQPTLGGFGGLKITDQRATGVYDNTLGGYDELFTIETATGGASTQDSPSSSVVLSVNGSLGSTVTRTTNRYHYYLPGAANLAFMTLACGDTGKAGNTRRWGLFDDNDGVFFELAGTTLNVVIRSSVTGVVTENRIPQSSWNNDKVDGTGLSGITLDITKVQVWWIDYQWLGAGRVRFGIVEPNGARLLLHDVQNANGNTLPYMRTGTLPFRSQNFNTGATGSSSELREICVGIYSEGNIDDYTYWRFADGTKSNSITGDDIFISATRLVTTVGGQHNSIQLYPDTISVYTDQPIALSLWWGGTVTGGSWGVVANGYDVIEQNTTATYSTTNALLFKTIYIGPGSTNIDLENFFETNDEGILLNADGTQEAFILTASKLGATNATIKSTVTFKGLW